MTHNLLFPPPVALFLRRVFNVLSTLAVSNQYLATRRKVRRNRNAILIATALALDGRNSKQLEGIQSTEGYRDKPTSASSANWLEFLYGDHSAPSTTPWRDRLRLLLAKESPRSRGAHTLAQDSGDDYSLDERFNEESYRQSPPFPSSPPPRPDSGHEANSSEQPLPPIYRLMQNPLLFDPVRKPRNPIVLCHGLYGYDVKGPSAFPMLQLHYWANVLKILKKKIGAEVIIAGVPGTGSIESRANSLNNLLQEKAKGQDVNFLAHSMGGLDCRHLITHVNPTEYRPASLLTVCTPHRGSPFMDWCTSNIGIGKLKQEAKKAGLKDLDDSVSSSVFSLANLPSSLTTFLLSILDSPAYANLSTHYLENVFNPTTPDDPSVRYYSVAARTSSISILHPLWLPKVVLDGAEKAERERSPHIPSDDWGNDGLVSIRSARWGEFLGTLEGCDHWDVRGGSSAFVFNNSDTDGSGAERRKREWSLDLGLSLPSGIRNSLSDPFAHFPSAWIDWGRLVGKSSGGANGERMKGNEKESESEERRVRRTTEKRDDQHDAVVKSSTEKISAIFDWLSDQAPVTQSSDVRPSPPSHSSPSLSSPAATLAAASEARERAGKEREQLSGRAGTGAGTGGQMKKFDLERFYVALTRKLYEDGF